MGKIRRRIWKVKNMYNLINTMKKNKNLKKSIINHNHNQMVFIRLKNRYIMNVNKIKVIMNKKINKKKKKKKKI